MDTASSVLRSKGVNVNGGEKEHLLAITQHLSTIRDRHDLWTVITQTIKPLVDFDDAVVITIDSKGQHYRHLMAAPTPERAAHPSFKAIIDKKLPIAGTPMEYFFSSEGLSRFDTKTLLERYPGYPGLVLMKETGLHYSVVVDLTIGGRRIGQLLFHFGTDAQIKEEKYPIYHAIAAQVAIAVSNILANEELLQREKETSLLLSLSGAMATIRDRDDLWRVMMGRLKEIVPIEDAVVICFSGDRTQSRTMLTLSEPQRKRQAWFQDIIDKWIPVTGPLREIYGLGTADWLTEEWLSKWPDFEGFRFMKKEQLFYTRQIALVHGGKEIGLLLFHFRSVSVAEQPGKDLYRAIGDLVAIAVSNILANEALELKTAEVIRLNGQLADLTGAVAPFQNRREFLAVVRKQFSRFLSFEGFYITWFDKEFRNQLFFIDELSDAQQKEEGIRQLGAGFFPMDAFQGIPELPADVCGEQPPIRLFRFSAGRPGKPKPLPIVSSACRSGLIHGLALTLRTTERVVGCLIFLSRTQDHFRRADREMLRQFIQPIGIGISNVVMYEEMIRGRTEIEKLNKRLQTQNNYLLEEVESSYKLDEFIGKSPAMQQVYESISMVSRTETSVLILGETGTGKELVARAIHNNSPRHDRPLIKLNCAALPAQLIESELFGHERGAFTGAIEKRIGKFEIADGSTLFLDEIGEMPLELQAKLLRALQEKEIERLGSNKVLKVNVRIIAATNRNLTAEVANGTFRSDLYYRLNVFPIVMPPLRDRTEDIPLLTTHFIHRASKKMGKTINGISQKVTKEMEAYDWPGNIRELEHQVERAVLMCQTPVLKEIYLPSPRQKASPDSNKSVPLRTLAEQERDYILHVLKECRYHIYGPAGAAAILNLPPSTLQSRMKKLGIKRMHVRDQAF